ncbi:cytidylate kinase [Endobacter medicaginis]|uniref:Cytidylate kinase n=3 Tax=Endobacter medicaginis TaxID=1181271 RepID=A0A839V0A6_9PROT|nr:(d)CMP kinase [Endobacter medicaginis]MBB3174083.1 cytidylate kinase [Endobacter medicaginis]MCX5476081.1 (d)CMP kinase [Endobacter medicaginis]
MTEQTGADSANPSHARLVIAVDGPAAAGKGTLAKLLAARLGLPHLDTGLLYRATAARLIDAGWPEDAAQAASRAAELAASLGTADLARTDLRTPPVDRGASAVAAMPAVRAALLDLQRSFAAHHGAVLDGRDIGTVIFPHAPVKLFVTASPAARARRRWAQLNPGADPTTDAARTAIAATEAALVARDAADAGRADAPLARAMDAVELDSSTLDIEAVLERALAIVAERAGAPRTDYS